MKPRMILLSNSHYMKSNLPEKKLKKTHETRLLKHMGEQEKMGLDRLPELC